MKRRGRVQQKTSPTLWLIKLALVFLSQAVAVAGEISGPAVTTIPEAEVHALLELKARISTELDASKLLLRAWNMSNTHRICESWAGVSSINSHHGNHVATIQLMGLGLTGSLPPHLGNLTLLSVLDLANNSLSGSIPMQLGALRNLSILYLYRNYLTGRIPPSIGNCSRLSELNLGHNMLHGPIPSDLGALSSLSLLSLGGNNLSHPIPASLSNCSSLSIMYLSSNELDGLIPVEFGALRSLSMLYLAKNNLRGPIPSSLGNCSSLSEISLNLNALNGPIPAELGALSALSLLVSSENNLTGPLPSSIGNCSSLSSISLNSNRLSGPIPIELGALLSLSFLSLCGNTLTGPIPSALGNCSSLSAIYLESNQLHGFIPAELGALSQLTVLSLWGNNLVGLIPSSLGNCSRLVKISASNNGLNGPIPAHLGSLSNLSVLYLWGNNLEGTIPSSLGNCTNLIQLYLDLNKLDNQVPHEIITLEHLQFLSLDKNLLTGIKPPIYFKNFTSLIQFSLGSNHLIGTIPSELGQLQQLQKLDLHGNQFSGKIPWESLSNCTSLYYLDLSDNLLEGEISSSLAGLSGLRNIYLQSNYLRGPIPSFNENPTQNNWLGFNVSFNRLNGSLMPINTASLPLAMSPSLRLLDLSHNHFYGAIPSWLEHLRMVQSIDLSSNDLTGSIPESLSNCLDLSHLSLSNNNLSGEFPLHLGSLGKLKVLDFSNNKLRGGLPAYLGVLPNLMILNVSFNNLSGEIPRGGAFKHLDASCFLGNAGLCGPIIQKKCVNSDLEQHHQVGHHSIKVALFTPLFIGSAALVCMAIYYACSRFSTHPSVPEEGPLKRFTAAELLTATQGYSEINILGEGALAVVYKGILSSDGKEDVNIAVKRFRGVHSRHLLLQELQILSKLRHRNLVRVRGCVLNLDVSALVLDFLSNGSLEQFLHHKYRSNESCSLSWGMFISIATDVANALSYLHHDYGVPIIHGDVKPSNILLDSDLEARLADFGLAKLATGGVVSISSNFQGSIGYMAPEYAYSAQITTKVDIYSFGVVVLEMLTGKRATQLHEVTFHEWVKAKLRDGVTLDEMLRHSLLQGSSSEIETPSGAERTLPIFRMALACTEDNPSYRPSIKEVLAFLGDKRRDNLLT